MKALTRSFVWWPGIDTDTEERISLCDVCTQAHHSPKAVPLLLWPWSTEPWQRIHIDYAEVKGHQFLLGPVVQSPTNKANPGLVEILIAFF